MGKCYLGNDQSTTLHVLVPACGAIASAVAREDVSFTPMAVPMISGPGAIGVVIGQATQALASTRVFYFYCLSC